MKKTADRSLYIALCLENWSMAARLRRAIGRFLTRHGFSPLFAGRGKGIFIFGKLEKGAKEDAVFLINTDMWEGMVGELCKNIAMLR